MIDALRAILELRLGKHPELREGVDSEPLELVIGASDRVALTATDRLSRSRR